MLDSESELVELHLHVGASVAPHVLWSIAHQQGFKLPVRDYWEFRELIFADPARVASLDDYLRILHEWTEKIQSSPAAMERSVYETIGKEYRSSRVSTIELRFNPMKRNLGGERDLDHIIHAALRGLDRACLEYGCSAALIFCLAREFDDQPNEILVDKAVRYRDRGVRGIDLAGTETLERGRDVRRYRRLFERARAEGLGTTVHCGETCHTGAEGVASVIEQLKPDRIGHGIRAVDDDRVLGKLAESGIVLEICPSSNLRTRAVAGMDEMGEILGRMREAGVRHTINTDGTYLLGTHLRNEFQLLEQAGLLNAEQRQACIDAARSASFVANR